jgi:hypothetical protein
MPLYYLAYTQDDEFLGAVIVEAGDQILARVVAEESGLAYPGALSTGEEMDPEDVPADMIGRRITGREIIRLLQKKPIAPSARELYTRRLIDSARPNSVGRSRDSFRRRG